MPFQDVTNLPVAHHRDTRPPTFPGETESARDKRAWVAAANGAPAFPFAEDKVLPLIRTGFVDVASGGIPELKR